MRQGTNAIAIPSYLKINSKLSLSLPRDTLLLSHLFKPIAPAHSLTY